MRFGAHAAGAAVFLAMAAGAIAAAEPRYFDLSSEVTRKLALRAEPAATGRRIGDVPAGATGLENKGCRGASDIAWEHLKEEIRAAMAKERWCRVRYQGTEGWVSARYLKDGSAPAAGATPVPGQPAAPRSTAPFAGVEWRVAAIGGIEPQDSAAWIRFRETGDLEGHTGCNSFRATYVAGTTALRIGPIAVTRMACPGEPAAVQERLLLGALEAAEAQQVAEGVLRLFDSGGVPRAVFRATR
jgi:heat shock protein HslJ